MKLTPRNALLGALVVILALTGLGAATLVFGALRGDAAAASSCIKCHISKENLAASLKAEPLPVAEKSSETAGEG